VAAGQYGEAAALLQNAHGVLAKIIIAAVQKENREQAAHYMELQSGIALSRMRQRLYYLSVIVTMAPLLGLLGTISGMISSFSVFNVASGQATAITGGVGEALIATAMGLCVAIAALTVHAYFSQRLESIITDMEQCFSLVEEHLVRLHEGAEHAAAGQLFMEGGTL
jgi:biopolymer transport protein ExbB